MKITEITRQGAELDTIAKIQAKYPNWKPGMPHPVTNEPTFKQTAGGGGTTTGRRTMRLPFQKKVKSGEGDPIHYDNLDPRYDDQARKSANQAYQDKFKDVDPSLIKFSKQRTGYLTPEEWDYKYGKTHNPDGTPKKIVGFDDPNVKDNPQATRVKNIKGGISSKDIEELNKNIVIYKQKGMFDPWAGIGSQQGRSTMRYDKQKNLYEPNNDINNHRLYGYVDSYGTKNVIAIDDSNISGMTYSSDKDKISPLHDLKFRELQPGITNLPHSERLSGVYVEKLQNFFKQRYKFYKPYITYIKRHHKELDKFYSDEFQDYWRAHSGRGVLGAQEFRDPKNNLEFFKQNNPMYSDADPDGSKRVQAYGSMSRFNVMSPEFWEKFENDPATAEKFIIRAKQVFKELQDPNVRFPKNKEQAEILRSQLNLLGFDHTSKSLKKLTVKASSMDDESVDSARTGLKLLGIDISAEEPKPKKESLIMSSIHSVMEAFKPVSTDLEDLDDTGAKVQIINPDFQTKPELQRDVPPRPKEDPKQPDAEPTLAKGKGVNSNAFAPQTKTNFKTMYGKDIEPVSEWFNGDTFSLTRPGLSENEPGNQPGANKKVSPDQRFLAVLSKDSVLFVFNKKDRLWYPSKNDLLYARAVERLTNTKVIDDAEDSWKRSQTVGQLVKGIKRDAGTGLKKFFGMDKNKPFDPGKTGSDFDKRPSDQG